MKYLIINADDFGRAHNNNLAIIDLFGKPSAEKIITDANLMVNMPGTKEAVSLARGDNIPLGVHFVLTSDSAILRAYPLSKNANSLTQKDGSFCNPILDPQKFWNGTILSFQVEEVAEEIEAQIKRFIQLVGKLPTHLTSHHHVHAHPRLLPVFLKLAKRLHLPLRIPVIKAVLPRPSRLKKLKEKVFMTDNFLVAYKGNPASSNFEHLINLLRECHNGVTEIAVHPAYEDKNCERGLNLLWRNEAQVLTDPRLPKTIAGLGFSLINYSQLKNYVS